jgi:paraquat-inducible protein A
MIGRHLVECHDCGFLQQLRPLTPGSFAKCRRCGATLSSAPINSLDRSLALACTGAVLLLIACATPFMSLNIKGQIENASLITGAQQLFQQGRWALAGLVVMTTMIIPGLKLGATLYVLLGLRVPRPPRHLLMIFRWLQVLHEWSMVEVYLLGVFVAYVKLVALATIVIGPACYALGGLMVVMVAMDACLSEDAVWEEMERRGIVRTPSPASGKRLLACESCGLVTPAKGHGPSTCPRCGALRRHRKPDSLTRTWALLATAIALYVPANIFPVMTIVSFGHAESDTILSGVKELYSGGMLPLALLVFFASITVPVLKITGLTFLLAATHRGSRWRLRDRTVLYRIIEFVGRWSMIDVFMISILVGLVRLGSIATIEPGVGAVCFAGVVIITMFAAAAFDPRLMWDNAGANR